LEKPFGAPAISENRQAGRTSPTRRHARLRVAELGDPEAIDLFLREEDAERPLADALGDEPQWAGLLSVEPVELDERDVSPN
jgi:hypothetical protein